MGTIADKLTYLNDTKTAIRNAVTAKGVTVSDADTFRSYADKIGQIQGGGGSATKFGVSIDNIIGNVDADGVYSKPTGVITLDLTGVKTVALGGFANRFYKAATEIIIIAPDLTDVKGNAFEEAFFGNTKITARFDALEEITGNESFDSAFAGSSYTRPERDIVFSKLKKINASDVFTSSFDGTVIDFDKTFPVLEEIQGSNIIASLPAPSTYTLSKVKKIVGGSSSTYSTFRMNYSGTVTINLPSATELSDYVCRATSSYKCNLHFAVANQAAIEACPGYEYKFGATEIYFDL